MSKGPPKKNFRCLTLRGQNEDEKSLQFNSKVNFFLMKALKLKAIPFINHLTDL